MTITEALPGRAPIGLRSDRGRLVPLDVERWFAEPTAAEHRLLSRTLAPVLDVGCGPARHTLSLLAKGIPALGLDISPAAVRCASGRGAPVLHRSVFDRLPDEGSWGTALLIDGNVGIGGDPGALLERLRRTLRRGGRILVEVEPPGAPTESFRATIDGGGPDAWFPWATVGADALSGLADRAGLCLRELWSAEGRWFGRLDT